MYNGGTEKVLSILLALWISMGYRVVLFTDEAENADDFKYPETVERIILKNDSGIQIRDYQMRALELRDRILNSHIDIMIYHAWMSEILLWDLLLVKSIGIPFVLYTHGVFSTIYHDRNRLTESRHTVFKMCDGVIAATEVSCRFYRALGCKVCYIPNPIDMQLMYKEIAALQSKNILWIGRISQEKRPEDAINIFELIIKKEPDADLYIVGDGSKVKLERMRQICKTKGLSNQVHFCGFQKIVEKYYLEAALMLMTSEFEGYCFTLLESKAYGLPCIMYDLPYLSLTKDKKGILTAPIGDIEKMAGHAIKVLGDTKYRKELGREARDSFEAACRFDLKKAWCNVFDEMETGIPIYNEDEVETQMIQLLVEHNNIGAKSLQKQVMDSKDFKIGNKVLSFPRKIRCFLKKYEAL